MPVSRGEPFCNILSNLVLSTKVLSISIMPSISSFISSLFGYRPLAGLSLLMILWIYFIDPGVMSPNCNVVNESTAWSILVVKVSLFKSCMSCQRPASSAVTDSGLTSVDTGNLFYFQLFLLDFWPFLLDFWLSVVFWLDLSLPVLDTLDSRNSTISWEGLPGKYVSCCSNVFQGSMDWSLLGHGSSKILLLMVTSADNKFWVLTKHERTRIASIKTTAKFSDINHACDLGSSLIDARVMACTFVNNPLAEVDRPLCTVPRILLQCHCNWL